MPKYLTIAEAQQQLPKLSKQSKDEPTIITGFPLSVIIAFSIEQFESLMETIEIISDKELIKDLRKGIKDVEEGEIISLDSLKNELGFLKKYKMAQDKEYRISLTIKSK